MKIHRIVISAGAERGAPVAEFVVFPDGVGREWYSSELSQDDKDQAARAMELAGKFVVSRCMGGFESEDPDILPRMAAVIDAYRSLLDGLVAAGETLYRIGDTEFVRNGGATLLNDPDFLQAVELVDHTRKSLRVMESIAAEAKSAIDSIGVQEVH